MTTENKQLPLKCTWRQLEKSYKKLIVEITGVVTISGVAAVMFTSPVAIALYLIMSPILEFVNPAFGYTNTNMSIVLFIELMIITIGLIWASYIVIIVVGTLEMYVYARTGVFGGLNWFIEYFDNRMYPGREPSVSFIEDAKSMNIKWVKTTLFKNIVMTPVTMIIQMVAVFSYITARFGIQAVICVTVVVKSTMWARDTFPAMSDPHSLFPVGFIFVVVIGGGLLLLILDPAVACLATNLNIKMLDE
jgi:hypothetical protein